MFWPTLQQPAEQWTNGCKTHSSSTCCNSTHSSLPNSMYFTLYGDAPLTRHDSRTTIFQLNVRLQPVTCRTAPSHLLYFSNWIVIIIVDILNDKREGKKARREEQKNNVFSIATTKCTAGALCGQNYLESFNAPIPMPRPHTAGLVRPSLSLCRRHRSVKRNICLLRIGASNRTRRFQAPSLHICRYLIRGNQI
jgi:hypothetical protein